MANNYYEFRDLMGEIEHDIHVEQTNEAVIITKVNNKGERRKRVKCKPGFKLNDEGTSCIAIGGAEKTDNKRAIKKANLTKKAKGETFKTKVKRRKAKAMSKRKSFGL